MKKPNITLKPKVNPLIANLSDYLKNHANYADIQRRIIASVQTTCSHSEMLDYANCPKCTEKMKERRKLLKELGFKNPAQYMAWREVHEEIDRRFPLVDWSKIRAERLMEGLK